MDDFKLNFKTMPDWFPVIKGRSRRQLRRTARRRLARTTTLIRRHVVAEVYDDLGYQAASDLFD